MGIVFSLSCTVPKPLTSALASAAAPPPPHHHCHHTTTTTAITTITITTTISPQPSPPLSLTLLLPTPHHHHHCMCKALGSIISQSPFSHTQRRTKLAIRWYPLLLLPWCPMHDVMKQGKEGAWGSDFCDVATPTAEVAPYFLSCGHEELTSSFPQINMIVMGKVRRAVLLFPTWVHVLEAWFSAKLHGKRWDL